MLGRSTAEAIYLIRKLMKKYGSKERDLHMVFVDLEKAYDHVSRDVLWKTSEKKGMHMAHI